MYFTEMGDDNENSAETKKKNNDWPKKIHILMKIPEANK